MAKILLLDDEPIINRAIEGHLTRQGHQVLSGRDGREGLDLIAREDFDLIITDLRMPRVGGIELLKTIREHGRNVPVIVLTAYTSIESAVEAMKLGASDYIGKPPQLDEITLKVNNLLSSRALAEENLKLRRALEGRFQLEGIIGRSKAIREAIEQVKILARDPDISILITGESGTGKELVARTIHTISPRADAPFVAINCGALPETLLETELFGHEKGAFTGAAREKKGLFEVAHRGTLFLDEVSAMPASMQVKLLRALQEKEIRRVGGTRTIATDIRILSASNQDPDELVAQDRLRRDLFYRLGVANIFLAPLRERPGDIALLASHFLEKFNREKRKSLTLATEAIQILESYSWPGNIRELEHLIELLVVSTVSGEIAAASFPARIASPTDPKAARDHPSPTSDGLKEATKRMTVSFERDFILRELERHHWNITKTAQSIGLSRAALHAKMKEYGIDSQ